MSAAAVKRLREFVRDLATVLDRYARMEEELADKLSAEQALEWPTQYLETVYGSADVLACRKAIGGKPTPPPVKAIAREALKPTKRLAKRGCK